MSVCEAMILACFTPERIGEFRFGTQWLLSDAPEERGRVVGS